VHRRAAAIALLCIGTPLAAQDVSRFELELEAGPLWQTRNDVQIPNDATGTRFSLVDLVGEGPWLSGRLTATWNVGSRHGIRVLLAPLSYTESGSIEESVSFAGETYEPGTPVQGTYQFNSWRLGYQYRLMDRRSLALWIGFTAKIRDAKIELRQGGVSSKDTDVGFVPLLHLAADWRFARRWHALLDFDGLAGGPGRAFDVALTIAYDLDARWGVGAGYRTLEGGADVESVYNFAWLHYAVAAARLRF
jgi:hypothetical protein